MSEDKRDTAIVERKKDKVEEEKPKKPASTAKEITQMLLAISGLLGVIYTQGATIPGVKDDAKQTAKQTASKQVEDNEEVDAKEEASMFMFFQREILSLREEMRDLRNENGAYRERIAKLEGMAEVNGLALAEPARVEAEVAMAMVASSRPKPAALMGLFGDTEEPAMVEAEPECQTTEDCPPMATCEEGRCVLPGEDGELIPEVGGQEQPMGHEPAEEPGSFEEVDYEFIQRKVQQTGEQWQAQFQDEM